MIQCLGSEISQKIVRTHTMVMSRGIRSVVDVPELRGVGRIPIRNRGCCCLMYKFPQGATVRINEQVP